MKKVLFVVSIVMLLVVVMAIPAFAAGQTKSDVCHLDDAGNYMLINIADPALDSHIAHGDSQSGDAVPGNEDGYVFGEDCSPVPPPLPVPEGPGCVEYVGVYVYFGSSYFVEVTAQIYSDPNCSVLYQSGIYWPFVYSPAPFSPYVLCQEAYGYVTGYSSVGTSIPDVYTCF